MRYLIISDIHSNLAAFEAVLKDAKGLYDKVWCLGDMVGYGPDPNECVELLLTLDHICLAGNHDWAVLDKLDIDDFHEDARITSLWNREQLNSQVFEYLDNLPVALIKEDVFTLVHASPRHPIWEYVMSPKIAKANFKHFNTPYCFVGHTHVPIVFKEDPEATTFCEVVTPKFNNGLIPLDKQRSIINPGSVGQPRDDDPRAAYGILDVESNTFEYRRIAYPVEVTQEKMKEYKLPARIWQRLALGE